MLSPINKIATEGKGAGFGEREQEGAGFHHITQNSMHLKL
jgi:hypothetical protein